MKKIIIVAVSCDYIIGINNDTPWVGDKRFKGDLQRFKELTTNNVVIMGRKTFESINCVPLPNRRNIVISSQVFKDVECFKSVNEALSSCQENDQVYFIGGGMLYKQALEYADELDMTIVPCNCIKVSSTDIVTHFPKLNIKQWKLAEEIAHPYNDLLKIKKFVRQ